MIKKIAIFLISALFFCQTQAQEPEKVLNKWGEQNPIEKIYFHFDRNDYIAGQTIWFKGYLFSDFLPSDKSTSLFVELLNSSSIIISRQVLPIFGGYSRGQIDLPDSLAEGSYCLRAYTATMLNHDHDFLYKKSFFIFGKSKKAVPATDVAKREIRMEFFPEGGNFISGLSNTIAYKATNENGLPVTVSGVIKKESGEQVAEFNSVHDGMGYFDLKAEEKTRYYAVLKDDPSGNKYYLPSPTNKGIVLRVISVGKTKEFEILQRNDDPVFRAAYMIGQMQHHTVFKKMFRENKDEMTGSIQTTNLSSGILQITVFNKDGLPLAERLTFVDNREYVQLGDITTDTLNFSARGRNHFTLSLKDTVGGSFSVSISDPAFDSETARGDNIFSGLLLTSDLKGYIHRPAWYFSSTSDTVQNALDLVMMTNGWRRFKWNDVMNDSLPSKKYFDPGYIKVAGKINLEDTRRPFADKDLMVFVLAADSNRNMLLMHTDKEGQFDLDSMVFFGKARIMFSDVKGKRSTYIDVKLNGDSLNRRYILPQLTPEDHLAIHPDLEKKRRMETEYNAFLNAEGLMLGGVTVKAKKKTQLQEVEEKYVSGAFGGNANSTLDMTTEDPGSYRNILEYVAERVPGIQVSTNLESMEMGYVVTYRQQALASSMGVMPLSIFLNEVPSDAQVLATIPANQVALVKVFGSFAAAAGNAPGGVLAVYTKKDADLRSIPATGEVVNYRGYSVIKEFYSPDYRVDKEETKKDNRITLYWNPSVLVADTNPKIPIVFYNNDRTRQFKIVVEGTTIDGKMLMIEKIVGGQKAF